jgi:hypothetical protein
VGDRISFPRKITEMALDHAVRNQTETAHRRMTALAKRLELMEARAGFARAGTERAEAKFCVVTRVNRSDVIDL